MRETENEDRIVYLSVPESLRRDFGNFTIDPSIPIPVELPPGAARLEVENLSWEMMVSGMLKVVARDPRAEDADYYRHFVVAVKPKILDEFTEAAILKSRNGDFELALEILGALQGLVPTSPTVALNMALVQEARADAQERAGNEEDAEEIAEFAFKAYKEALAFDPPFPEAYFNAGFFYMKKRNFVKAKDCFSRYLLISEDATKRAKAAGIVKEIEARDLDDSVFREAYDFIRMGEEEKGIEKARDFLLRHSAVWNGWFLLGWGLRRMARWEDAIAAFRKAAELGGGSCDVCNELAICLMETGKLALARKELEKALRLENDNVKVISNLGVVALRSGNKNEAAAFFRTVLELAPEDQVAKQYLEEL
ncbi:MAG: tetratricopeptide repeat protein [Treponemataceae bacterium]